MFDLTDSIYQDANAAREYLETLHWPDGAVCPRCGDGARVKKLEGKSTRPGVHMCNPCRQPFTVTVGTIFEDSKVPLNKWLLAFRLMAGSKKGVSAHQLHRSIGVTYKTAWFMAHRIRESMREGDLSPFGSEGGIVEVDETYIGRQKGKTMTRGGGHKMKVLALVDRDSGRARTMVLDDVTAATVMPIVKANVVREAVLMTDESRLYHAARDHFAGHGTTNHSLGEYVDIDMPVIHSNTVEGYFSIFKRGMRGIYQHCGEQHLHRYLAEFDFRYSNRSAKGVDDAERTDIALRQASGRRLTYRRVGERARAQGPAAQA